MNEIITQLRALIDQLEQAGANQGKQKLLPHDQNPRQSMQLSDDGEHFLATWWMEGYVGALAGVRLADWKAENYGYGRSQYRPQHYRVLVPNAGQTHVSPADLGWIDASAYDPAHFDDQEARTAAWVASGCPTVGARGKFDVRGDYIAEAWR